MALTPAEKMRRRRLKLKEEGKYEEYNEKIRNKMKTVREKQKLELQKCSQKKREKVLDEERRKIRERVAKYRRLKKEKELANSPIGFKNVSSLGKATARVRKVLPKSPTKRKSVVKKLFLSIVETDSRQSKKLDESREVIQKRNSSAISSETIEKVKAFYERDDISRQTPGIKDVISVRNTEGKKEKVQVRYLCYSVTEVHALFVAETNIVIGKSKFAELRPQHVKLSSKSPHNVCLCKYHENFINAVTAFHKAVPTFQKYSMTFCESFFCNPHTQNCWLQNCGKCANNLLNNMQKQLEEDCLANETIWYEWKEVNGSLTKVVNEGSIEELVNYINNISNKFFQHVYVKREQAASYNKQREEAALKNYDPSIALVQIDFSENYTCIAQDEIQSYHWCQSQVSLFTCSLWFEGKQHPYVIVSDNLDHSKDTLLAYVKRILDELPKEVLEVRIWSDGPSSQFKNKYVAAALKVLQNRTGKRIIWNYFATSHGKGPVDGIGGALKRAVRQEVLKTRTQVFNAKQFYSTSVTASNVNVILMDNKDIADITKELNLKKVFETSPTVKGISQIYSMKFNRKTGLETYFLTKDIFMSQEIALTKEDFEIGMNKRQNPRKSIYSMVYGSSSESDDEDINSQQSCLVFDCSDIQNGVFVKVQFEHENCSKTYTYAAICQTSVDTDMDVRILCLSRMANSKRLFRVNTEEAEPYIKFNQILQILPFPEIKCSGERMYYKFTTDIEVNEK